MRELGIGDASEYDVYDTTDFRKARDMGVTFAIIRATTTGAFVNGAPAPREDARFVWTAGKLAEAGIERLSYLWYDPRPACKGLAQAQKYEETVLKVGGPGKSGKAVFDIERSGQIVYTALTLPELWAARSYLARNWDIAVYSNKSDMDILAALGDISIFCKDELIVANWQTNAPLVPYPWWPDGWYAWQYTSTVKGSLYGFNPKPGSTTPPSICLAVR